MVASAATLALLALAASGLLDLVFKLYSQQPRSRGMLVCGIGCVWVVLQLSYTALSGLTLSWGSTTWAFGLPAAIFVTLSNILLIECMGHLPISMASTIYRLNTVPLVVLAAIFLGEEIGGLKGLGIVAGLVTVFLLYHPQAQPTNQHTGPSKHLPLFLALVVAASCLRALYGVVTKAGISAGADANTMMLLGAIGWCFGGLAYAAIREHRVVITRDKLKFIPVAGTLVFSIVWLLTTALTMGDASVVVPLANMGFVAAFFLSLGMRLETLSPRKAGAMLCAIAAIVLLTAVA